MNVERLRAVQAEEREADSLRALPDSFYREVADYIGGLREQRTRVAEEADDPFGSEEVRRLTDEIETAEEVAEAIYERRVGKLVKRASLAAAGMPADEEGLTAEEARLFSDLVAQIEAHRDEVLATFDGDRETTGPSPEGVPDELVEEAPDEDSEGVEASETTLDAGAAMGSGEEPSPGEGSPGATSGSETPPPPPEEPAPDAPAPEDDGPVDVDSEDSDPEDAGGPTGGGEAAIDTDRVTLRITRDVGEVFGVDERVYDLASEDVVTLPAANAKPLLDRDAAEKID